MLLLWIDEKGLQIYNAADLKKTPGNLEMKRSLTTCSLPTSGQCSRLRETTKQASFSQLKAPLFKEEDLTFDEHLTKAKLPLAECQYHHDDCILRDTLVFWSQIG